MVQLQYLSDDLWVAVVFMLPVFVVEDDDIGWLHPICHIKGLNAAAELGGYAQEAGCVTSNVCCLHIFGKVIACCGESIWEKSDDAVDGVGFAKAFKLRWGKGEPCRSLWMRFIYECGIHNTIGLGVWKWMKKRGVDQAEYGSSCAYPKSERKYRDN